eukprot:CAMPEP_0194149302 /NCGR_PEP_ID=MMETSP0152-20130528/37187_1 /TAXON_ID=1049557 /ORGANISM="Thalassiothrix antarctica, Strain L6-D1" /LENGTH=75 /DNA_ID=CAMNT_0038851381 /DNA_START=92 /DNA_END=319 /DNA_ORIENTATION=+
MDPSMSHSPSSGRLSEDGEEEDKDGRLTFISVTSGLLGCSLSSSLFDMSRTDLKDFFFLKAENGKEGSTTEVTDR